MMIARANDIRIILLLRHM